MPLARRLDHLTWFGLGPHETYADRQGAAHAGVHSGSVQAQLHPYLRPQVSSSVAPVSPSRHSTPCQRHRSSLAAVAERAGSSLSAWAMLFAGQTSLWMLYPSSPPPCHCGFASGTVLYRPRPRVQRL
jgi:hypothetical protein